MSSYEKNRVNTTRFINDLVAAKLVSYQVEYLALEDAEVRRESGWTKAEMKAVAVAVTHKSSRVPD